MSFALTREGIKPVAKGFALALALFQIWFTTGFGVLDGSMMRVMFVSFITVLVFLFIPCRKYKENEKEPTLFLLIDLCCAGLAIATAVYFALHLTEITTRMRYIDDVTPAAKFFAAATVLLVLEITRRTTGWALVIVASTLILYAFFGDMLPRAVKHTGFTFDVIVEHLFLLNEGVYGIPIGVATSTLFGFIMFGAFLERSKMSSIFMDLACLLTRNSQGGPAKVAIFASALFGTISGSAAANVYGTGTFTIPLMKKVGYRAPFAGAVEAVASTGGQLMPPVMGTAAFLMADLSGAGYLNVAKAALLPAILYYLALLVMIHFEAVKNNLGKLSPDMVPETKSVVSRLYYLVPIAVLILLLGMGRSVVFCANIATLSIVLLAMLKAETRFTFKSFIEALVASSRGALMVSACCACSGLIVGVLSLTGIGYKFINLITILAGDSLFLLMVYLMLHGHPDHSRLHRGRHPRRTRAHQGRGPAARRPHVRVLLCDPVLHHPARVRRGLRGGCHRRKQGHGDGLYRPQARHRGLHRALHVRLSARAPRHRRNARNHLGRHHSHHRRHRHRGRYAELASVLDLRMGTRLPAHRRADAHLSRPLHRHHRLRAPLLRRHRPDAPPQESTHRRITQLRQEPFLRVVHPASRPREGCFGPTIISHKQLQGVLR